MMYLSICKAEVVLSARRGCRHTTGNMLGSGSTPSIRRGACDHSPPHDDLGARLEECVFEGMP